MADSAWISLKENVDGSILSTKAAGKFVGTYPGMFARNFMDERANSDNNSRLSKE
jgi:hypothetical protein